MRITNVHATTHSVPIQIFDKKIPSKFVYVQVDTDEGITGHGITGRTQRFGVKEFINMELNPFLKGKNPLETEALWHQMYSSHNPRSQTGMWSYAVSAIDIALWDIKGKYYDEPVWRLLGGAKNKVPAYVTFGLLDLSRQELVDLAKRFVRDGYNKLKLVVGVNGATDLNEDVVRIREVREAIGSDVELMIDANCKFSLNDALSLSKMVEPYHIAWFEEPVYGNDVRLLAELRKKTPIPIAAGQNEGSKFRHLELLLHQSVDFLQPNVCYVGGFTEGVKVAGIAQAFNIPIINGGGNPHHNMHLQAATANGMMVEFHYLMWNTGEIIFKDPPRPQAGFIMLPEKPGLGLDPNDEALRKYQE